MKIVIHIGMHKTGSSSIQHTFAQLNHPDLEYIRWSASGNHSALFVLLFEETARRADYHAFKARGPEFIQRLPALREEWYARVSAQLAQAGTKTVIFSAEDISAPFIHDALPQLHDFFSNWSDNISVIGYVRPPADFMASVFQQYLKGGTIAAIHKGELSPHYRARFEQIDQVFGRENVRLKVFSPDRLLNGDVVQDFAREIGVAPLAESQVIRTNESLSLEAIALLYVQRKLGLGFFAGFDDAHEANDYFISQLASIGRRKFNFSQQMLGRAIEVERDGIVWMQDRLGHEFSTPKAPQVDAISSLDELVDIALEQFDSVQTLMGEQATIEGEATIESLMNGLERLREQSYEKVLGAVAWQHAKNVLQESKLKGISTVASKIEPPETTEEELHLRRVLASILWHADHRDDLPINPEDRKAAYDLVKQEYWSKAYSVIAHLSNNSLKLVEIEARSKLAPPKRQKTRP